MNTKGNIEEEKMRGKDRKMKEKIDREWEKGEYKLRGGMVGTTLLERVTVSEAEGRSRVCD